MAGVFPSIAGSRTFAFILFILLVWIAVDLSKLFAGLFNLPPHVAALVDPNSGQGGSEQTKL